MACDVMLRARPPRTVPLPPPRIVLPLSLTFRPTSPRPRRRQPDLYRCHRLRERFDVSWIGDVAFDHLLDVGGLIEEYISTLGGDIDVEYVTEFPFVLGCPSGVEAFVEIAIE